MYSAVRGGHAANGIPVCRSRFGGRRGPPLICFQTVSSATEFANGGCREVDTVPEIASTTPAFLTEVIKVAEPENTREHRQLFPQQFHGAQLVRRDHNPAWSVQQPDFTWRNNAKIILVETRTFQKWSANDDDRGRLRPEPPLVCFC